MAKTIKFNLIIDGKAIRTIEELQENFCVNDVAALYESGTLQHWLKVRGYDDYLKKVNELKSEHAILDLIKIFGISKDMDELKQAVFDLYYTKKRQEQLDLYESKNNDIKKIIADYHSGYEKLKEHLKTNRTNMPLIKSAVDMLANNYIDLFKLNYKDFYYNLTKDECLIVYALLMNEKTRKIFFNGYYDILGDLDLFTDPPTDVDESIKYNFSCFEGNTDGYWKELECNKKVMVLSLNNGRINNSADRKNEISEEKVNGKFIILDGLAFQSTNSYGSVVYMVV